LATRLKAGVAKVLREEGFIIDFQVGRYNVVEGGQKTFEPSDDFGVPRTILRVYLKYGPEGERVIRHIRRISRPGLRIYRRTDQLRRILDGLGIAIISTSKGVMSDRQAREQKVGGEVLANVW